MTWLHHHLGVVIGTTLGLIATLVIAMVIR